VYWCPEVVDERRNVVNLSPNMAVTQAVVADLKTGNQTGASTHAGSFEWSRGLRGFAFQTVRRRHGRADCRGRIQIRRIKVHATPPRTTDSPLGQACKQIPREAKNCGRTFGINAVDTSSGLPGRLCSGQHRQSLFWSFPIGTVIVPQQAVIQVSSE